MLVVTDLAALRPDTSWWVPALAGRATTAEGRRGSRFLVDAATRRPALVGFPAFDNRAECLRWIMAHRAEMAAAAPGTRIAAVRLAEWMLGMDGA